MAKYYYLDNHNQPIGPVEPSEFAARGLTEYSFVWTEGMPEWKQVKDIPDLDFPGGDGTAKYAPGSAAYASPFMDNVVKPSSNLVWGILTTICCCMPLGIVSIVYASQVDTLWYSGQYQEAKERSRKARNWAIWAAVLGCIGPLCYLVLLVMGVAASATSLLW